MLVLDLFYPLLRTVRISSLCHGRKRTRLSEAIVSLPRASMTFPRGVSQVIIDLSESNSRLEVENRRLRASAVGLREALMKRGGEAEVKEFDDAYNLTSLFASSRNVGDEGGVPQLVKREASERGSTDDAENEIPTAVKSSRRLLGRLDSEHTDLHSSWR